MHAPFLPQDLSPFCADHNDAPPRHLGTRYSEDGIFLNEPGNTVVCHLVEGSLSAQAIIKARQSVLEMPEAATHLAFTSVSSLHMTLFQGIIEFRRDFPFWPNDMPSDASIDAMTDHYRERLKGFPTLPAFSMQVTGLRPLGLTLAGASAEDEKTLALWRDTFAEFFGYRHPDHETYEFHITFAYIRRWFDAKTLSRWQGVLDEGLTDLRAAAPTIALRPPAFCRFADMNHFEELIVFNPC